ncbi:MAG: glycosyltransferase [Candidatus Moranbacteria bacterium]|nr:glycosyltransferase [Candidatus Moranbacteria bacterium]
MLLSIIIPTFNEEKTLPRLLESLSRQTFRDFEIIVADNHSTDATRTIAGKAGVRVVDGGSPAQGRNNGAKAAAGEWLLFLDADTCLPSDFLEKATGELTGSDLSVASCLLDPLSDRKIDKIMHGAVNFYFRETEDFFPHATGSCIFAKREAHRSVGGYDERVRFAEDQDYVMRLSRSEEFGFLRSVRIPVSVRRLDKDGRLRVSVKYIAAEAHLIFIGPIYTDIFRYRFGNFG